MYRPTADAPAPPEVAAPATALCSARVLVVDDHADTAESLALLLTLEGHQVRTAPDAETALELLGDFVADVALLDIGLPGMDGHELAVALRADPRQRAMRLVALTGWGCDPEDPHALAASFDAQLTKPVEFAVLLATLRRLL